MPLLRSLLSLCLAPVALSAAGLDQQVDDSQLPAPWAAAVEDACSAEDASCALSLRQLRAQQHSESASPEKAGKGGAPAGGSSDEQVDEQLAQREVSEKRVATRLIQRAASTRVADRDEGEENDMDGSEDMEVGLESSVAAKPGGPVQTLYHQTSPEIGAAILREGFRPGTRGWCGGAIYFATTPQATYRKAIGLTSGHGFIIEAKVNVGRVKYMPKHCGGWMSGTVSGPKLSATGFDSIRFNPGDGDEVVIYDPSRVISMKEIHAAEPPPGARPAYEIKWEVAHGYGLVDALAET